VLRQTSEKRNIRAAGFTLQTFTCLKRLSLDKQKLVAENATRRTFRRKKKLGPDYYGSGLFICLANHLPRKPALNKKWHRIAPVPSG
jgi:hypothetical protein